MSAKSTTPIMREKTTHKEETMDYNTYRILCKALETVETVITKVVDAKVKDDDIRVQVKDAVKACTDEIKYANRPSFVEMILGCQEQAEFETYMGWKRK